MTVNQISKRRPRAELRRLMLQAGVEVYVDLDPSMGGERVNYANVFRHLEDSTGVRVTYGSVHERIWDSQRDFQLDVIRTTARQLAEQPITQAVEAAEAFLATADISTVEGRRAALREAVRVSTNVNVNAIMGAPLSRIQRAIQYRFAGLSADSAERAEVEDALNEALAAGEEQALDLYDDMLARFRAKPRADMLGQDERAGLRQLTRLVRSMVDGSIILDAVAKPESVMLPTGANGEDQPWSTAGLGTWAIIRGTMELVDDAGERHAL